MNAISVFLGALGLDIGIRRAGFNVCLAAENNKDACATILANQPDVPIFSDDITNLNAPQIYKTAGIKPGDVTLLFGGPPCQSYSTTGKMKGIDDSNGDLIFQFVRLVCEMMPSCFLLENVSNILSEKFKVQLDADGSLSSTLVEYLYSLFNNIGYKVSHSVLNAADYGVPQLRKRVFFIGTRCDVDFVFPHPTHSKETYVNLQQALAGLDSSDAEYLEFPPSKKKYLELIPEGGHWRSLPQELQMEAMGKAYLSKKGGMTSFFRRLSWDKPSPTLLTSPLQKATTLCHPDETRPLSVQEYLRIQQFPDEWVVCGNTTSKYKQIGNAVPVGLANAIGNSLVQHILSN